MSRNYAAAAVFVLALLLYLPSAWNGFAYDDNLVIVMDERIHDLSSPLSLLLQPYWLIEDLGLYRPLPTLSYAVDWALSGGRPAWFHVVNMLWNAAACVLVFVLLRMFVPTVFAAAAALLFAAHPVHVEAVANIVGRAELMAAVFSLAAMVVWLGREPHEAPGPRRTAAVTALYSLALLSKESAVMLPALLLLADAARGTLRPQSVRPWLHRHAAAFGALAAAAAAYLALRVAVLGGMRPGMLDPVLDVAAAPAQRIMTALQAWPEIVRLFFFPRTLLADYGPPYFMPAVEPSAATVAGAVILVALVAGGAAAWLRGHGRAAFVLLFAPVALLPVSNLLMPIGVVVAERALYLPSVALAAAFAFGAAALSRPGHRRAALAGALAVAALFAIRTLQRIPDWDSTDTVFAALERDVPDSFRAHWHFARVAAEAPDTQAALRRYGRAVSAWPFRKDLTLEAAAYAARVGDLWLTGELTRFAVGRWPGDVGFLRLHAAVLLDGGAADDARHFIERGLAIEPADSTLHAMRRSLAPAQRP